MANGNNDRARKGPAPLGPAALQEHLRQQRQQQQQRLQDQLKRRPSSGGGK